MKMKISLCVLFVMFGVTLFLPFGAAMACRCAPPGKQSAAESYAMMDLVVKAKIVALSKGWSGTNPVAMMEITHIYKGNQPPVPQITARYNSVTAACGLDLQVGENYVLGLYYMGDAQNTTNGETGYRLTNACDQANIRHHVKALEELGTTNNIMKDSE